ncbi:MAG: putative K(+)-stimulated pyrophosphate-energized sodium pump, partial [Chloroflexi bacterium OLB13]
MDFLAHNAQWLTLIAAVIGIGFAVYQRRWILAQPAGNEKMTRIAGYIRARRTSIPAARTALGRHPRHHRF